MDDASGPSHDRAARSVPAVDWSRWTPDDHATLVFVIVGGEILLIRKKRGLGAGKINGPGGKIDPGETAIAGAVREVEEELRATPTGLARRGLLRFQFVDGYAIHVTVFVADGLTGVPRETPEAVPLWTPVDRIPYDEMWADDRIWLPMLLAGHSFSGRFLFDGDAMLFSEIERTERSSHARDPFGP